MPSHTQIELIATCLFAFAVLHTFSVKRFQQLALQYPEGSIGENFFHLIGEVEIVFGLWAAFLVVTLVGLNGREQAIHFVETLNFTEPAFVFVIMAIASTRPILVLATRGISLVAQILPLPKQAAFYGVSLFLGPLLGSFITEPAAMTVTALILKRAFFDAKVSTRFKYISLAVLFVNVSIGGVLTHFAAPPVLMVASTWQWTTPFMFTHFGWKAIIGVSLNTVFAMSLLWKELKTIKPPAKSEKVESRWWLNLIHLVFLGLVVSTAHHPVVFAGIFLFFLGVTTITQEFQDELKLKDSLLVGFFLGGLVVLGALQSWWLKPILTNLSPAPLFIGATALTGIMDNAALTYLGAQVPGISEALKYALVAGAVAGGGLTVIANAPNPAGFAILRDSFGKVGISPIQLLKNALIPTLIAMACFWFLP